jgi:beta-phosphoglucomutase-like phosphatase (HAD superfamily)
MPGGALFDVDGTLVDSTYHHTLSWWQAFRRSGRDVVVSRIHRAIGMGAEQLVPHVLQMDVDDDEISSLASAHDAIYAGNCSNGVTAAD